MDNDSPNPARRDRLIHERYHDPYSIRHKLPEPTICSECGAIFHEGRWSWQQPESGHAHAHKETCPACRRIRDGYPAGTVELKGKFLQAHQTEIENLIRNLEKEENQDHPLNRIMAIEQNPGHLIVKTTDIHLPHRIGHALKDAYGGDLDYRFVEESYIVRVYWSRD